MSLDLTCHESNQILACKPIRCDTKQTPGRDGGPHENPHRYGSTIVADGLLVIYNFVHETHFQTIRPEPRARRIGSTTTLNNRTTGQMYFVSMSHSPHLKENFHFRPCLFKHSIFVDCHSGVALVHKLGQRCGMESHYISSGMHTLSVTVFARHKHWLLFRDNYTQAREHARKHPRTANQRRR